MILTTRNTPITITYCSDDVRIGYSYDNALGIWFRIPPSHAKVIADQHLLFTGMLTSDHPAPERITEISSHATCPPGQMLVVTSVSVYDVIFDIIELIQLPPRDRQP